MKDKLESLQEKFSPHAVCFGCGPSNPAGLHLRSFPEEEALVADWHPGPYHAAFDKFTSGGIMGILFDCHGNITASYALMKSKGLNSLPGTVTAEYSVRFQRPTPLDSMLHVRAWATKIAGDRVSVEGTIEAEGVRTATMSGVYVAVTEGHPAFEKWS